MSGGRKDAGHPLKWHLGTRGGGGDGVRYVYERRCASLTKWRRIPCGNTVGAKFGECCDSSGASSSGEAACQLAQALWCRHQRASLVNAVLADQLLIKTAKEKELVLHQRSTDGHAGELVVG